MKTITNTPFIFGKIKIWSQPVFDLEELGSNPNLKNLLEERLNVTLSKCFIKSPNPKSVLGKIKETIRFDYGIINEPDIPKLFNHFYMGFGERGLFYDVHLNHLDIDAGALIQSLQTIDDMIQKIFQILESDIPEIYFNGITSINDIECWEINNFECTFNISPENFLTLFPGMMKMHNLVQECTNEITRTSKNTILPKLQFDILSNLMIKNPPLFHKAEKYLPRERFFIFDQVNPEGDIWKISSRGIDFQGFISILKLLGGISS